MNSITFYLQFVQYSNKELLQLKSLISSELPDSKSHLISNQVLFDSYNISNSIGRVIYIRINDIDSSEVLNYLSSIDSIIKSYNQLNLFVVRINKLFINAKLSKRYLYILNKFEAKKFLPTTSNLLIYYYLVWMYINMFHVKYTTLFNYINHKNLNFRKTFSIDYI